MRSRRTLTTAISLPLAALLLAACGGGADSTDSTAEQTTAASETAATSAAASPSATASESADASSAAPTREHPSVGTTRPAEPSSAAAPAADPGPAAAGAVLPADIHDTLPDTVGDRIKSQSDEYFTSYSDAEGRNINVNARIMDVPAASVADEIAAESTPAGTGTCGLNSVGVPTCYLAVEGDKALSLSAESDQIPLADVVAFANQLSAGALQG